MLKKLSALYALVLGYRHPVVRLRHPARPAWCDPALAVLALRCCHRGFGTGRTCPCSA